MSAARRRRRRLAREAKPYRRFILVRAPGRRKPVWIETTACPWCTAEAICRVCGDRAEAVRVHYSTPKEAKPR